MKDEKNNLTDEGFELSDEMLDSIAGGAVYHDPGDAAAHRQEAFYVIDDAGTIVMRTTDMAKAKHWAGNLRASTTTLTADEFERLRRR